MDIQLADVLASLSHALDLTEGHPPGHAERSCLLGIRIAEHTGLSDEERSALYYALLLKDAGCSVNAAPIAELYGASDLTVKASRRAVDHRRPGSSALHTLRNVAPGAAAGTRLAHIRALIASGSAGAAQLTQLRCERGAEIVRAVGLSEQSAQAVRTLDEHWDGGGYPRGLSGEAIPLLGRIMCLAQTVEIFWTAGGPKAAREMTRRRRGRWFDPALADVVLAAGDDDDLWRDLETPDVRAIEPHAAAITATDEQLEVIASAFSQIVDAKSPYTASHSRGVAELAAMLALDVGLGAPAAAQLYRAGLLHDLGKLAIPNTILDKPGKLDDHEWQAIRRHPATGHAILQRIPALANLARPALTHHERLDGSGYPHGLTAAELDVTDRILAVADVGEALSAKRPYRESLSPATVLEIMDRDRGTKLDAELCHRFHTVLPRWHNEASRRRALLSMREETAEPLKATDAPPPRAPEPAARAA